VHRVDLIIGGQILLELKAVENLHMVHRAQVLSCLRVTRLRVGLLINFNVAVLASGIQRIAL
jgi:GxxExxY protein